MKVRKEQIFDLIYFCISPSVLFYFLTRFTVQYFFNGIPFNRNYFTESESFIMSISLAVVLFGFLSKRWSKTK